MNEFIFKLLGSFLKYKTQKKKKKNIFAAYILNIFIVEYYFMLSIQQLLHDIILLYK